MYHMIYLCSVSRGTDVPVLRAFRTGNGLSSKGAGEGIAAETVLA